MIQCELADLKVKLTAYICSRMRVAATGGEYKTHLVS